MTNEPQKQLNEETELALGRFVVRFSGLLAALESSTIHMFGLGPDGHRLMLIGAALSERTASPIAASFFSVIHKKWGDALTAEDREILKALRREIDDLIKERNRLMHDAWLSKTVGGDPGPHPLARFRLRAHGRGADYEIVEYQPEALAGLAADATRLASVVNACAFYMRDGQLGPELVGRIRLIDGKVQL